MPSQSINRCLLLLALVLLATGCASVRIQKIVDNKADGPSGMRFYMPRPYVVVNEPFVVASTGYLASGAISADGQHVIVTNVPPALSGQAVVIEGTAIPASTVALIPIRSGRGEAEGDAGGEKPLPTPPPSQTAKPSAGILNLKVTNDNAAFAMTPMKRYFDITWLPDFAEQYVVRSKGGFGNASVNVAMGQGWSLQGLDATVDNSSITAAMMELIQSGSKILSSLGKAAIGLPGAIGTKESGTEGDAGGEKTASSLPGGVPVTLKIHKVRLAAPGLYPILKPDELKTFEGAGYLAATVKTGGRVLIPLFPATNIAFNVYDVIVVQAARADGDSPLDLHRYLQQAAMVPSKVDTITPSKPSGEGCDEQARADFIAAIGTAFDETGGNAWVPSVVKFDGKELALKFTKQGTPTRTQQAVDSEAATILENSSVKGCFRLKIAF